MVGRPAPGAGPWTTGHLRLTGPCLFASGHFFHIMWKKWPLANRQVGWTEAEVGRPGARAPFMRENRMISYRSP